MLQRLCLLNAPIDRARYFSQDNFIYNFHFVSSPVLLSQMFGNIAKNALLLRSKSTLLKRYNVPQIAHNVRSRWNTTSSKDQSTTLETEDDDVNQPIKYSTSKAATMRIDEYRDPYGDDYPWYQSVSISLSLTVFLGYFCILREENDIDLILDTDLGESLSRAQKELTEKKNIKV